MALGEPQVTWGFEQAQKAIDPAQGGGLPKPDYPAYYGNSLQGPGQQQVAGYVANQPYQQVGGLMGGDYNRLEQALQAPIYQQQQDAIAQLNNTIGGRGLYGSTGTGMHDQSLNDLYARTGSALSQATAQRFGMQMEDMGQRMDENRSAWAAGLADAQRRQGYDQSALDTQFANDEAQRQFANSLLGGQFDYSLAKNAYDRALVQDDYAAALGLATGAIPAYGTSLNNSLGYYNADQQAQMAQSQADAANTAGWLGAGGSLLGGMLGSDGFWNLFS